MRDLLILAILDGWGVGSKDESNPLHMAKTPNIRFIEEHFPCGSLQASGVSIGLPWETAGTSEIGHLTLGAGKIIYQNYPKVSLAIRDGSFFENRTLIELISRVKEKNGALHLVGLLASHTTYSAKEHLFALLELAKRTGLGKIFVHVVLDGKGETAHTSEKLIAELQEKLSRGGVGTIATVSGTYWAMPNDADTSRTEAVYRTLTGNETAGRFEEVPELLSNARKKNPEDEFLAPGRLAAAEPVGAKDGIIFTNFEPGGLAALASAFTHAPSLTTQLVGTLTDYGVEGVSVAFPKDEVKSPLGKVLADAGKSQMRIAESLKYRSIAFYFNGLREHPFTNEYHAIVPSLKTLNVAEHPEMMAETVTKRALMTLNERGFDFVALNYANPDIVASTGDYEATKHAAEIVDAEIGKLLKAVQKERHTLVIVGSHGNAEMLLSLESGEPDRRNNPNPVPFYLIKSTFQRKSPGKRGKLAPLGLLSDVAPTLLDLMKLQTPEEMTGTSLLKEL